MIRFVFCVFAIMIPTGCQCFVRSGEEANKALVRKFIDEAFNQAAVHKLQEFVSPDYTEIYNNKSHRIGIKGAKAHVLGVRKAFPDLVIRVERQFAEGVWVITQITVTGTHQGPWLGMKPTGKSIQFTSVNVDKVINGRIVEHSGAANLFSPLLEAGALQYADPE